MSRARGPGLSPVGRRPGRVARGRASAVVPLALVVLVVVLVLVLVGCNGATDSGPATAGSGTASEAPTATLSGPGSEGPSTGPADSLATGPTDQPTNEPSPEPTASDVPTDEPTPAGSPSAGGTDACLGSAQTRDDFFATFAQDVSWPVYCGVLPKGWSVEDGHFQLKNGGRLWIIYRRRSDGAKLVLDQGSVCADTTPCVPAGDDLGTIPFGDRQAALSSTAGGDLSAVVDQTENPAWLLTGSGIDPKDFKTIAARLHLIDQ